MNKKKLIGLAFILMGMNFSNAQDTKVAYSTPQNLLEINAKFDSERVDTTFNSRKTFVENFKDERKKNIQKRRKFAKNSNPMGFVYRLLGI